METKTVNLRDVPIDLVRRAKAYAALRGMTLKDFVIQAVATALENDVPAVPSSASGAFAASGKRGPRKK